MKSFVILIFCFLLTQVAIAKVVTYDDSSLEQDLNFKYEEEVSNSRDVASDNSDESIDSEQENSADRDVASDTQEDSNPTIQYWKY